MTEEWRAGDSRRRGVPGASQDSPARAASGTVVAGRFELARRIGSGGHGAVWLATDLATGERCAAKLVHGAAGGELIRAARERSVRLDHPHVLSPYAWAEGRDLVVIASELVRGGSLATLLADHGPLPWRYVAELLAQLLDALAHVHGRGLVHRDVKPANILLHSTATLAPHLRLSDFGLVHAMGSQRVTRTGFVVGTPGYLAPEVLAGRPPHASQDLFAAGAVAAQLISGSEEPGPEREPDSGPLRPVVTTLCSPDPRQRLAAAGRLAELRAAVPLELPALTADGEPVEIFDVLSTDYDANS
ncbi:serine/threonine-protein kinase [Saccharomonospora sp. NPDC006951]